MTITSPASSPEVLAFTTAPFFLVLDSKIPIPFLSSDITTPTCSSPTEATLIAFAISLPSTVALNFAVLFVSTAISSILAEYSWECNDIRNVAPVESTSSNANGLELSPKLLASPLAIILIRVISPPKYFAAVLNAATGTAILGIAPFSVLSSTLRLLVAIPTVPLPINESLVTSSFL